MDWETTTGSYLFWLQTLLDEVNDQDHNDDDQDNSLKYQKSKLHIQFEGRALRHVPRIITGACNGMVGCRSRF